MTFVDKDGEEMCIKVPIGMSMLEAAHENDIELEGNFLRLRIVHLHIMPFAKLSIRSFVISNFIQLSRSNNIPSDSSELLSLELE